PATAGHSVAVDRQLQRSEHPHAFPQLSQALKLDRIFRHRLASRVKPPGPRPKWRGSFFYINILIEISVDAPSSAPTLLSIESA
ncbi:hypothetical protein, partial [Rhizobium johnstonii]|uniref:hypothetical protein n=1 Tax=Rhizobium johnstonii TaxID=3019933 RepID=UPI003F96EA76